MNFFWSKKTPDVLYTVIVCKSCSERQTRAFADGDVVLAEAKCTKCAGSARIEMIYSAPPMQQ